MAETTRKFYIVDLIRDRKLFPNLDVPPTRVNITIVVNADVPKAKMDRLEAAARAKLEEYETVITKNCEKFNKKIDDLLKAGKLKEAIGVADEVNNSVKAALASAEAAANKAVDDARKKEAQGDKLLLEARIKTTVTFVFGTVKVATSVTRIGVSHGADVHAWYSLVKELVTIGLEIKQLLKDEPKLRKDVVEGIKAYLDLRGTIVMQAATRQGLTNTGNLPGFPGVIVFVAEGVVKAGKEVSKGRDKNAIAKEVADFVVKGIMAKYKDAEKARTAYREECTIMRQKVDKVSAQGDKLFAAMKKATDLKQGVKIGAECMAVRGKATRLGANLQESIKFLDAAQATMVGFGLQCDDSTIMQKIKALDVTTILTEGTGIVENISAIKDLVSAVASAVA